MHSQVNPFSLGHEDAPTFIIFCLQLLGGQSHEDSEQHLAKQALISRQLGVNGDDTGPDPYQTSHW